MQTIRLIGEIQAAAIPALRVAFTIAVLVLASDARPARHLVPGLERMT